MTAVWYETDHAGQDPPVVGKALLMAGVAAFVWGAGCVALALAIGERLWQRGRR